MLWGILCVGMAIYLPFIDELHSTNNLINWHNVFYLALLELLFLPMGIISFLAPLTSKIIISAEGIEYHNLSAIVKAHWSDMDIRFHQDVTGEVISARVSNPEIFPRAWTRFAPWNVRKGVAYNTKHHGIPVSQFGGFTPKKLIENIRHYLPQHDI